MSTNDEADGTDESDESDEIVGLLAEWASGTVAPVAPPAGVRARLLATLASAERFRPFFEILRRNFDLGADALADLMRRIDASSGWEEGPLSAFRYFHFQAGPALAGFETGVVRLAPGGVFPRHRHRGPERTFVLDGYVEDGGRVSGPGTFLEMPAGSAHDYRACPGRELILVSMHGGIDFLPA
jgi:quercetin dioxygenase-like cupin family protein